ncbi:DUF6907 domain-containing protein [Streptomyces sp. NPDC087422]|uniref:DUF6907 domain-containing protein n=1 Tax=Streptomyces sp. NPDC087422 TaxID=3365786 RepID=UPI00380F2ECE
MTERRTIIVPSPHGPVTVSEPDWCVTHGQDALDYRAFTHRGADFNINIKTPTGSRTLLTGRLEQPVWPTTGRTTDMIYSLDFAYGDTACDPEQLRAVYRSAAGQLRQLLDRADQLEVLRGGGR